MAHELRATWGPEQNPIIHFIGCFYAGHLGRSAFLAKAYQENTLDIGLDTFPHLVSISAVRECMSKNPPNSSEFKGFSSTGGERVVLT